MWFDGRGEMIPNEDCYCEINPDEAREFLLFIAQYAGYPRAASMLGPVEEAIAEFEKESADS